MRLQTFTMLCVLGIVLSTGSVSLNAQVRVNDNLGNHTATKDLDMTQHAINNIGLLNYYLSTDIGDVTTDTNIGAANVTVDKYTIFQVNQTTANRTLSLLAPTNNTLGRKAYVKNTGTAPFLLYGVAVPANRIVELFYNGSTWSVVNTDADAFSLRINKLIAATATNSIDNKNFGQVWDWSTLTTGRGLSITSSSPSFNSTDGLFYVANTAVTTTGTVARIQSNASTPGSGFTVLGSGNVGIGTTTPGSLLDVNGTANISGASTLGGTLAVTGAATLNSTTALNGTTTLAKSTKLAFTDASGSYTSTFVGGTQSGLINYTLPVAAPTDKQVLQSSNTGVLNWTSAASLGTIGLTLGTGSTGNDINVSGSPASLGSSITLNIPDASETVRGVVTKDAQIFGGAKTFKGNVSVDGTNTFTVGTGASTLGGTLAVTGAATLNSTTALNGTTTLAKSTKLAFTDASGSYTSTFVGGTQSGLINYTLPVAAPTTDGQVLVSTAGGVLSWSDALSSLATGKIFVGDNNGKAAAVSMHGDATIATDGTLTIGTNKVTNAQRSQMAPYALKGNDTNANANESDLTADQALDAINNGTSTLNSLAVSRGGTGIRTDATPGALVYGSSATALGYTAVGSNGQVLVSGADGAPTWTSSPNITIPINNLADATYSNTIDNKDKEQTWNWSTLAAGNALSLAADTKLANSNTQTLLNVSLSGTTSPGYQTTYGARISNSHIGYHATNVGLELSATGGDDGNYALLVPSGLVGIGTSAPTHTLEVSGTANVSGVLSTCGYSFPSAKPTANWQMIIGNTDGTTSWASLSGTAPITYNNGAIGITQANSTTDGYLSKGDWAMFDNKVSLLYVNHTGTDVIANTANAVITLYVPDASTGARGVVTTGDQGFGGTKTFQYVTVIHDLVVNGSIDAPSDIRLKTHIETLTNVLAKIENLRGVRYEFINQKKYAAGPQIGVIAQELQKEFPELVVTTSDGYLAVDYTKLTGVLIQAVKEQQQEIKSMKEALDGHTKQIEAMMKMIQELKEKSNSKE